jgi:hypothetical protein
VQAIMGLENTASAKNADETINSRPAPSRYADFDYFELNTFTKLKCP